jgi:hypothetical protein
MNYGVLPMHYRNEFLKQSAFILLLFANTLFQPSVYGAQEGDLDPVQNTESQINKRPALTLNELLSEESFFPPPQTTKILSKQQSG